MQYRTHLVCYHQILTLCCICAKPSHSTPSIILPNHQAPGRYIINKHVKPKGMHQEKRTHVCYFLLAARIISSQQDYTRHSAMHVHATVAGNAHADPCKADGKTQHAVTRMCALDTSSPCEPMQTHGSDSQNSIVRAAEQSGLSTGFHSKRLEGACL